MDRGSFDLHVVLLFFWLQIGCDQRLATVDVLQNIMSLDAIASPLHRVVRSCSEPDGNPRPDLENLTALGLDFCERVFQEAGQVS
jgi:hypothetical protein